MSNQPNDSLDKLLEWHLNLLNPGEAAWMEAQLQRDATLREQSKTLGRILRPLDQWSVHAGPSNLVETTLRAVRLSSQPDERAMDDRRGWVFPSFRSRDLIAAAASIVVLLGAFVPASSALRSRSQRVLCANNMHTIGMGLSQYQATFAGSLPFAGFADSAWLPGADPTCYSSNSRHVFLLRKLQFVTKPNAFVCPSSKIDESKIVRKTPLEGCDDFGDGTAISYDSHNLAGPVPNLRPQTVIAYLADPNPLFIGQRFNENIDPQVANSPAHGGCGQTILLLDGRAEYFRTPVYGQHKDNVWTIEGVRRYTGVETPKNSNDSFLVPGAPKLHR